MESSKENRGNFGRGSTMIVTREVDYSLRILRTLSDGKLYSTKEICDAEDVSVQFAYKIIKKLSGAGIVEISRGAAGGCRLAADLESVSLYDLMVVMKAKDPLNACTAEGYVCPWREEHGSVCNIHENLRAIQEKIYDEYKKHSIAAVIRPIGARCGIADGGAYGAECCVSAGSATQPLFVVKHICQTQNGIQ